MTAQEFFAKWNFKPINYDESFGNQCMDLYHQYVTEVLPGYPHPRADGAAFLIGKLPTSHYTWFNNGPLDVPKLGDILLWGTKAGGGFGHVAIYSSGNVLSFTSFDQNFPFQGYYDKNGNFIGTGVCHFQGHNYFGDLKGWYRPKVDKLIPSSQILSILNGAGSDGDKLIAIRKLC